MTDPLFDFPPPIPRMSDADLEEASDMVRRILDDIAEWRRELEALEKKRIMERTREKRLVEINRRHHNMPYLLDDYMKKIGNEFGIRHGIKYSPTPFSISGLSDNNHVPMIDRVYLSKNDEFSDYNLYYVIFYRKYYRGNCCPYPHKAIVFSDGDETEFRESISRRGLNLRIVPVAEFPGFQFATKPPLMVERIIDDPDRLGQSPA